MYNVIYSDPPWRYSFSRSKSRKIENQYETILGTEGIINQFPTEIEENAVLYLWATAPKLPEAFEVIEALSFTYKTCAVWDKHRTGMGYWFRGQHELLLVATRGKFSPPIPSLRRSSVFSYRRGGHSVKPFQVRDHIQRAHPDGRAVEVFARWTGNNYWDTKGDESS